MQVFGPRAGRGAHGKAKTRLTPYQRFGAHWLCLLCALVSRVGLEEVDPLAAQLEEALVALLRTARGGEGAGKPQARVRAAFARCAAAAAGPEHAAAHRDLVRASVAAAAATGEAEERCAQLLVRVIATLLFAVHDTLDQEGNREGRDTRRARELAGTAWCTGGWGDAEVPCPMALPPPPAPVAAPAATAERGAWQPGEWTVAALDVMFRVLTTVCRALTSDPPDSSNVALSPLLAPAAAGLRWLHLHPAALHATDCSKLAPLRQAATALLNRAVADGVAVQALWPPRRPTPAAVLWEDCSLLGFAPLCAGSGGAPADEQHPPKPPRVGWAPLQALACVHSHLQRAAGAGTGERGAGAREEEAVDAAAARVDRLLAFGLHATHSHGWLAVHELALPAERRALSVPDDAATPLPVFAERPQPRADALAALSRSLSRLLPTERGEGGAGGRARGEGSGAAGGQGRSVPQPALRGTIGDTRPRGPPPPTTPTAGAATDAAAVAPAGAQASKKAPKARPRQSASAARRAGARSLPPPPGAVDPRQLEGLTLAAVARKQGEWLQRMAEKAADLSAIGADERRLMRAAAAPQVLFVVDTMHLLSPRDAGEEEEEEGARLTGTVPHTVSPGKAARLGCKVVQALRAQGFRALAVFPPFAAMWSGSTAGKDSPRGIPGPAAALAQRGWAVESPRISAVTPLALALAARAGALLLSNAPLGTLAEAQAAARAASTLGRGRSHTGGAVWKLLVEDARRELEGRTLGAAWAREGEGGKRVLSLDPSFRLPRAACDGAAATQRAAWEALRRRQRQRGTEGGQEGTGAATRVEEEGKSGAAGGGDGDKGNGGLESASRTGSQSEDCKAPPAAVRKRAPQPGSWAALTSQFRPEQSAPPVGRARGRGLGRAKGPPPVGSYAAAAAGQQRPLSEAEAAPSASAVHAEAEEEHEEEQEGVEAEGAPEAPFSAAILWALEPVGQEGVEGESADAAEPAEPAEPADHAVSDSLWGAAWPSSEDAATGATEFGAALFQWPAESDAAGPAQEAGGGAASFDRLEALAESAAFAALDDVGAGPDGDAPHLHGYGAPVAAGQSRVVGVPHALALPSFGFSDGVAPLPASAPTPAGSSALSAALASLGLLEAAGAAAVGGGMGTGDGTATLPFPPLGPVSTGPDGAAPSFAMPYAGLPTPAGGLSAAPIQASYEAPRR